jgi:radical SAM protein with 4Fe4S-binding SPASM domain
MSTRLKTPLDTQIEVTSDCPHACRHCYNYWRTDPKHPPFILNEEQGCDIVEKLAACGVFNIVLTGGEPLLNLPTCMACIESARDHGMRVMMNSNLVLLSDASASRLRSAGLDHILTSICGPDAAMHDHITQRPGSFDWLVAGIRIAKNARIRVSANMVVSRLNVGAVGATAETAARIGASAFCATKACCPGSCRNFSDLRLTPDDLTRFLNGLSRLRKTASIPIETSEPVPLCALSNVECPEQYAASQCYAGMNTMTIAADGSVRPCPHLDVQYGNILSQSVEEVWHAMDPWRKGEYVPSVCRQCIAFPLCGGGCRMEAKAYSGKLDALDPYADPPHAAEMAAIVKARLAEESATPPHSSTRFKLTGFRMREESFGGAIMLDNGRWVLVDPQEYAILTQLKHDAVYPVVASAIDWHGLNPEAAVRGLVIKHLATFVEDSYRYELVSGVGN